MSTVVPTMSYETRRIPSTEITARQFLSVIDSKYLTNLGIFCV